MLETDVAGAEDAPPTSTDVVERSAVSSMPETSAAAAGLDPVSPPPPLAADLLDSLPAASKPSTEDGVPRRHSWDCSPTTASANNNDSSFRYPIARPEAAGPQESQPMDGGNRTAEVATALAGVHSALDRIDSVAEKQQLVGEVIVHLQVLRCRLQLAQVLTNQSP